LSVDVKICGLSTPQTVRAAVDGGARYVGFVFFPASPRAVTPARARELAEAVPAAVTAVGLVVDADDETLRRVTAPGALGMLQLHGRETPERVAEIKSAFGLPVIKAVAIADAGDVAAARAYQDCADMVLFDAKAREDAGRPGGNARPFDWNLLGAATQARPWLLAGGLTAENLAEAVRLSGAPAVDVSSGVEDSPGVKNEEKIRAFLEAAARL